jgi:hypothetical protein
MKLFNFFKAKADKTIGEIDEHSVENNQGQTDIEKEKLIYGSETTLVDVLNYIRNNCTDIGIQLNKPASDIGLETFKNKKFELPNDFKLLYQLSNGFETDHDLFRLIPLDEIIENGLDKNYLINDISFHFTEYMIYSDMWSVDIDKDNPNSYRIYNKVDAAVYLTNSLAEFLCVFISKGIYDGLYAWRETKEKSVQ